MLIATVVTGLVLPIRGVAADVLKQITFWAVALLFFLYGAKFDAAAIRSGMLNWRLQRLTFAATYLLFPILGLALMFVLGSVLGPGMTAGNVLAAICAASFST